MKCRHARGRSAPRRRRTPHGVRGLKCRGRGHVGCWRLSHPSRGAWIEIALWQLGPYVRRRRTPHGVRGLKSCLRYVVPPRFCRTPHGVRGLKCGVCGHVRSRYRRTPHGVRGLKYRLRGADGRKRGSHPSRGAWIEIPRNGRITCNGRGRTPHGVRGLKCLRVRRDQVGGDVAPLTGCVD